VALPFFLDANTQRTTLEELGRRQHLARKCECTTDGLERIGGAVLPGPIICRQGGVLASTMSAAGLTLSTMHPAQSPPSLLSRAQTTTPSLARTTQPIMLVVVLKTDPKIAQLVVMAAVEAWRRTRRS
jgi:hypothetical protein